MNGSGRLETWVAALLRYGSWVASVAIALGLVLAAIGARVPTMKVAHLPGLRIATVGISLFIGLPTLRVLLMLYVFIRQREHRLATAAGIVLAIILAGIGLSAA